MRDQVAQHAVFIPGWPCIVIGSGTATISGVRLSNSLTHQLAHTPGGSEVHGHGAAHLAIVLLLTLHGDPGVDVVNPIDILVEAVVAQFKEHLGNEHDARFLFSLIFGIL